MVRGHNVEFSLLYKIGYSIIEESANVWLTRRFLALNMKKGSCMRFRKTLIGDAVKRGGVALGLRPYLY